MTLSNPGKYLPQAGRWHLCSCAWANLRRAFKRELCQAEKRDGLGVEKPVGEKRTNDDDEMSEVLIETGPCYSFPPPFLHIPHPEFNNVAVVVAISTSFFPMLCFFLYSIFWRLVKRLRDYLCDVLPFCQSASFVASVVNGPSKGCPTTAVVSLS